MRVFVAGATGAVGRQLIPQLFIRGHQVTGMTSRPENVELLRELGAIPMVADALDPEAVGRAVSRAEPEAIVHQLTALSNGINPRHQERDIAPTNRLRTEGTDHLLSAGRAVGVKRFVAQSFLIGSYARNGSALKTEDDPLDPDPPAAMRSGLDAVRYLEKAVTGAMWTDGIALRYGLLYGPGTSLAFDPPGDMVAHVRRRTVPVIGGGSGVWSLTHVEDAASAAVAALERGRRGIYNIVDDEPVPVSELLPALADAVGAKSPRGIPRWLGRLLVGEGFVGMMTEARGASNAKAKRELGWTPTHPSWRRRFAQEAV